MNNSSVSSNCVNGSCKVGSGNVEQPFKEPTELQVFSLILLGLVILTSLLGNILVIKALLEMIRKPFVYCLVTNLAVSELINTICIPFAVSYLEMGTWVYGDFLCKIMIPMQVTSATVVTTTIAMISIRRFQLVTSRGMNFPSSRKGMWLVILGIWMFGIATSLPLFIFHQVVRVSGPASTDYESLSFCVERYPSDSPYEWPSKTSSRYSIARIFLCFVAPVLIMIISYGAVTVNIKKHIRHIAKSARGRVDSMQSNTRATDCNIDIRASSPPYPQMVPLRDIATRSQEDKTSSPARTEMKALLDQESDLIRMFYIIIFIFIVFYLPFQIFYLLHLLRLVEEGKYGFFIRKYLLLLTCFPSALHPLCYGTKSRFYAKAFKKLILCKR
ncbi:beta-1 adrenergic receptor-like [Actinia tenebrosa]|uniref:Beta-1 adrenergic receptor-like n=1 Tax=Actinia tenebrosa TaxID=6105 RepID=A0A6P8I324_ACTTE|nr:beta-1 adrenergic receptor-like [Actinia tenebrosa]